MYHSRTLSQKIPDPDPDERGGRGPLAPPPPPPLNPPLCSITKLSIWVTTELIFLEKRKDLGYEKPGFSYCVMFWCRGCRGNLKLITPGSQRVNQNWGTFATATRSSRQSGDWFSSKDIWYSFSVRWYTVDPAMNSSFCWTQCVAENDRENLMHHTVNLLVNEFQKR